MTREEFRQLTDRYIYLDGATGSNLVRAGMPSGACPEQWILEHPETLYELQKRYVEAGTDILYAPTFTANRIKLAEYGLESRLHSMIRELVSISRKAASEAADRRVYVAGDLTMTGRQLRPVGDMELEELIDVYKEAILAMQEAGVDLLVVETMMSLAEARAALIAAKEVCDLPVMVTMTFEADGRTLYGTDARTAAVVLESLGAVAVGVNCSTGPAGMRQIVSDMVRHTRAIPIIAKPNAGLPYLDEQGVTRYSMDAESFAEEMTALTAAGATILGGCCGTASEYIRRLQERFGRKISAQADRCPQDIHYLTSERRTVAFRQGDGFLVVGERINPTGKKAFQAQLREGSTEKVLQFAEEQEQCGASVLDVNMGMSGIDEQAMMLRAIEEISGVTNLPLSLDSSHVEVLEAALRHYPGRALINSVSMEKEKYERLIPVVAKYGAMFILLPLSDAGLPESMEEKKQIIQKILARASEFGLEKQDVVVDGLVTTVGANKRAALEALETIRYCCENGLATICGLSNISFGMPERSYVNTAFLTLAIREGLTMAIANPSQELLMSCAMATDLLLAKEEAELRYIDYVETVAAARPSEAHATEKKSRSAGSLVSRIPSEKTEPAFEKECQQRLYHAVLKGNRSGIADITKEALQKEPDREAAAAGLLHTVLLPAINEVGELFDKGRYFLPQLIGSAEAMQRSIEVLEPLLMRETDAENMPVVVIATVEGDIHDIGKNLVALMLKNYGFRVIDLGKDVPKERIIEEAKKNGAQIIALSALMTTTMQRMREIVPLVKRELPDTQVMIGGAVITQEFADEIGAHGYSRDAAEAVRLAQRLCSS